MQYIQLQGQVAADLDLPIVGSYNLFIDTSDNSIKAKDSDGHMHGGGGLSLTEVTREEIQTLVDEANLTPGAFYKITNAASRSFLEANGFGWNEWNNGTYSGGGNEIQDGGTTIILQATTDKTLSKKGIGLFYVPNYEDINNPTLPPDFNFNTWSKFHRLNLQNIQGRFDNGEYIQLTSMETNTTTYGYLQGSLYDSGSYGSLTFQLEEGDAHFFDNPDNLLGLVITGDNSGATAQFNTIDFTSSYSPGTCVVYGGRVWENLSGNIGTTSGGWPDAELYLNHTDWAVVPFNETHYTIKADAIEYEFEYDNISYRSDGVNEVYSDWKWWDDNWGYNMIKFFPWGHPNVERCSFSNSYLSHFVNFPHDAYAENIKFEDGGGFNAHSWGRRSGFYSIQGDKGAHFTGHDFATGTDIYDIKLGVGAYMSGINTYDNNDQNYSQIYQITLGNNASFRDFTMYYGSYIENVEIGTNASLQYFTMYEYSAIRYGLNMDVDSYMQYFDMWNNSETKYLKLGVGSGIGWFDLGYSSCLKRITLGTDSYISGFDLGIQSFIRQVTLSDRAYINNFNIGDYSNLQNINLGAYSYMYNLNGGWSTNFENIRLDARASIYGIHLGYDSAFSEIEIAPNSSLNNINHNIGDVHFTSSYVGGISVQPYSVISNIQIGTIANFESIYVGNNSYFGDITLEEDSAMSNINLIGNTESGNITLQSGSTVHNFEFGMNAGFGPLIVTASVELNRFEVGNGYYFGEMEFTSSMSNITISRGFNNLGAETDYYGYNGGDVNSSNYMNLATNLSYNEKHLSVYAINPDGNDFSENSLDYYLPDGLYNGQTIELVLVGNSNNLYDSHANGIRVWMGSLRLTGGGLYNKAGYVATNTFWFPFSKGTNADAGVLRDSNPKAIWLNGAWTIDNGNWAD